MEKVVLAQIEAFIEKQSKASDQLKKTSFAAGYAAGLEAVSDIIQLGKDLTALIKKDKPAV